MANRKVADVLLRPKQAIDAANGREGDFSMSPRKLLLTCFLLTTAVLANAQNPLAGLTILKAEGGGTGNTGLATGTLRGDPIGIANWTYTVLGGGGQTTNGQGGNCNFQSGNIAITAADGSTLQMQFGGDSCNTGVGPTSSAVNNVVYIITSGTGRFSNTQGTGNVALAAYNPNANTAAVYIHFDGNINLH